MPDQDASPQSPAGNGASTDPGPTGFWAVAEHDPGRLAVVAPDHSQITFGELAKLSNRAVHGMRAMGLSVGDQVCTVLPNSIEQLAMTLAAIQGGYYISTVNFHLVADDIAYILEDSACRLLVAHSRFAEQASQLPDKVSVPQDNMFSVGELDGYQPWSRLVGGQPDSRPDGLTTGSMMFYTSGTTGRPKGVRRALGDAHPDESGPMTAMLLTLFGTMPHDDNVHITQAPLYHTAVNNWTISSLHMGHTVVLMDKWTPQGALERIERYRVTHSHMVPTMFHRLLKMPVEERGRHDLSSLRQMIHAAAPCPVETKHKMLEWWGPVIWEYYAATEGGGTIVSPEDWLRYPGTVGKAWPMSEVKVFNEDGDELPAGESGTIYMRMTMGDSSAFEYHKDEKKTAESRLRGYFTVGDIGYFNEDGYLFLNDRKSDMIISGGVNLYPAEIEGVLHQHEQIADVAVFGIPDPDRGERIMAVVQPMEGVDERALEAALRGFVETRLSKQKWPHDFTFQAELPRDPNGKLYKRKLRDPYWAGRGNKIV